MMPSPGSWSRLMICAMARKLGPWWLAAGALLYFLVPDYFRPMFVNPLGWVMLGISAGLLVIGNVIIRRITKIA